MLLFSHPTGNANVRHAALALHEAGLLRELWTGYAHRPGGWVDRCLPSGLARQFRRREFPPELTPYLHTMAWRELARLAAPRVGLRHWTRHEDGWLSVDGVYRALDARVARRIARRGRDVAGVYAYEDGAAASFAAAERAGLVRLYDQPIGYWRAMHRVLREEAELQPAWAATLQAMRDSPAKTARKDEELARAQAVFVASSFTRQTLHEAPGFSAPVTVIPYGAPAAVTLPEGAPGAEGLRRRRRRGEPLRVLFVGSLGQRKGLSYLFDAVAPFGPAVELTVIGTKPAVECPALDAALGRCRWIPSCPHAEVLAAMGEHDVFVFPSLFEGFGLVILEAMAQGLPVIATPHTAGPDLIDDGVDGCLVPIRSADSIAAELERMRSDPDRAPALGAAARRKAATFTWAGYRQRLAAAVRQQLAPAAR
jgi:starch synthase